MGARWMKKNMNRAINEKYFNDPVQNAAFICCIDVLAELVNNPERNPSPVRRMEITF